MEQKIIVGGILMIHKLGQVMLYITNQDKAVEFWSDILGFSIIADQKEHGMRWIELSPSKAADAGTNIILHNKELIAKMSPELNLGTPSLMFFSDNLDQLYIGLKDKGITVGELVQMGTNRIFNFADYEGNYFAVMEKK